MPLAEAPFGEIEALFRELEKQGRDAIAASSVRPRKIRVERALDMRYVGQEHAVTVHLPMRVFTAKDRAAIKRYFDNDHMSRYGTSAPGERAEIVSLRVTVSGQLKKPPQETIAKGSVRPPKAALAGRRKVFFGGRFRDTPTFRRVALLAGNKIVGPALIEEHASTTMLMPGDKLTVDAYGNLVIAAAGAKR
jgi:N-methylhydantoinase A